MSPIPEPDPRITTLRPPGTTPPARRPVVLDPSDDERGRIFDSIALGAVVVDERGIITRANRAWHELVTLIDPAGGGTGLGQPYVEVLRFRLGATDPLAELERGISEVRRGLREFVHADLGSHCGGTHRWFSCHGSAFAGDRDGGVIVIHADITAQWESIDRLAASEARYRTIIDTVHDVVFQCDDACRFTFLSSAWEHLAGLPVAESLGQAFWTTLVSSDRDRARSELCGFLAGAPRQPDRLRYTLARRDGSFRTIEMRPRLFREAGQAVGTAGTIVDVTDQLEDEVEVRHAQKLEAVGRLAAGIAHEINTPVQFVGDNLQFLDDAFDALVTLLGKYRSSLSPDSEIKGWAERQAFLSAAEVESEAEYLEEEIPRAVAESREGANRIASIVRAMKAFGHPDTVEQQATDLNEAVRNTVVVARNEYKYLADMTLDLEELPTVVCHTGDVNQALLNLVVNAAQAIGDVVGDSGERGRIIVSTRLDGDVVLVSVADTGPGIPTEIRHRVFDPFFTTKEVSRGTGQGLALVRAVADRHHGQVWFETGPGGTTFTLRLPLAGTGSEGVAS